MKRSTIERIITREEANMKTPRELLGTVYDVEDVHYRITVARAYMRDSEMPEKDKFFLQMDLIECHYHEPTSPAQWQGTDKLARNTRHAKPIKYACHLCRHFLANPTRIDAVSTTQAKPTEQANQAGLF